LAAWIFDWSKLDDDAMYIVCPINVAHEHYYLGQPLGRMRGWEVKRLRPKCYAALLIPELTHEQLEKRVKG
jgi:hypothetical protein